MKYAAAVLGSLIVIVIGVLLAAPGFVDWNRYKPEIVAIVKTHTGFRLAIDGVVELRLLPSPRMAVTDARLVGGDGGRDLVRFGSIQAHVAFLPLLRGELQFVSLALIRPTVLIEGRGAPPAEWLSAFVGDLLPPGAAAGWAAARRSRSVRFDSVDIIDGAVILDGAAGERSHRIERWYASLSAPALNGPFEMEATALYRDVELSAVATLGEIAGRPAPASLRVELPDDRGSVVFIGVLDVADGLQVNGETVVETDDFRSFAETIAAMIGGDGSRFAALTRPFQMRSEISATPAAAKFGNLDMQLGGMRLTGVAQAEFAEQSVVTADFALGHLDLDAFDVPDVSAAAAMAPFVALLALPDDVKAFLSLSADAVSAGDGTIRQLNFEAVLERGALAVEALTATLPGGTTARLDGALRPEGDGLRFVGRATGRSDNLRAVLAWWGMPLPDLPPDRLHKVAFDGDVDVTATRLQLRQWTMAVDSTSISGTLQTRFGARPVIAGDIEVDSVNLDAYLQTGSRRDSRPGPDAAGPGGFAAGLAAFADVDIRARIGRAQFRDTVLRGVTLDMAWQPETVELRGLSIDDLAGAAVSVSGTLSGTLDDPDARPPDARVELTVDASSAARLVRLAGLEVTNTVTKLGRVRLTGRLRGPLDELTVDGRFLALDGHVDIQGLLGAGWLGASSGPPGFDLTLAARHPRAARLAATLFDGGFWEDMQLGAGALSASLVSRPDDGIDIEAVLTVADGRLQMAGVLQSAAQAPSLRASVAVSHPDIRTLLPRLAPGLDLGPDTADEPDALEASLIFDGDAASATMRDLAIAVGAARLSGEARFDLDGSRPDIALDLRTGEFDLAMWLLDADNPAGLPAPADRAWSREPLDVSALQAVDLDLDFSADEVLSPVGVITDLSVEADVADGALSLQRLSGGLLGGTLSATGVLSSGAEPQIELELDIKDAVVGDSGAGRMMFGGVLDYEGRLTSRGDSRFALISGLQGDGRFQLTGGVVDGIDLPALGALMQGRRGGGDAVTFLREVIESGMTPFDRLHGRYAIVDGTLQSDDIRLEAPAATGRSSVTIDLLNRQIDARSEFRLTDHPDAPSIVLGHVGSLSDPRRNLDTAALTAWLQREASAGSPASSPPDAAPAPSETPAPTSAADNEEALRDILRTLIK